MCLWRIQIALKVPRIRVGCARKKYKNKKSYDIYPGDQKYALDSKITAIPLEEILQHEQTGLTT